MSHDIRTPLNGIIGYLDLEDGNLQNQELLLQYRKNARVAANHLLSLINDVLNMSKLEDDKVDRLFDNIREEMVNYIAINKGQRGSRIVDLIMVTKYLERIGDHATNIAEWVEFSITGVHRNGVNV